MVFAASLVGVLPAAVERIAGFRSLPVRTESGRPSRPFDLVVGCLSGGDCQAFSSSCPAAIATLALALFAIDDARYMPIGWLAARNGLVAAVPAFVGLCAHLRWRQDGWRPGAIVAVLGFAVGLAGGEMALAVLGYVVAFELIDGAGWRRVRRAAGLLPYVLLLLLYAPVRAAAGAGGFGSGVYFGPTRDPIGFSRAAAGRVPALLGNSVWKIPAELWGRMPVFLVGAGIAGLLFVLLWLRSALQRFDAEEARHVRWLALGASLSLVPSAGGMPGERCIVPATVGAAVVVAVLVRDGLRRWRESRGGFRRALAGAMLVAIALPNVVLAAPLFVGKLVLLRVLAHEMRDTACAAPLDEPSAVRALIAWSDNPFSSYGWGWRAVYCPSSIVAWMPMSLSQHPQTLSRPSATTLTLDFTREPALDDTWEILYRDPASPMQVGTSVTVEGGLRVTVREIEDGRPKRVSFEFAQPIEQSEFRLLVWRQRRLKKLELRIGESATFAGP